MAKEHNIKTFTAADIERYHKGLLSAKERNALEKAALDDPFLADALEGYAAAGVNAKADIAELKKRLSERVDERKIIPINTLESRKTFPWLRAAAMIILIGGAGLLVYQFAFNNKSKDIAQLESKKKEEIKSVDSGNTTQPATTTNDYKDVSSANEEKQKTKEVVTNHNAVPGKINRQTAGAGAIKKDTAYASVTTENPSSAFSAPKTEDEKNVTVNNNDIKDEKKAIAREDLKTSSNDNANAGIIQQNEPSYKSKESVAANQRQENRTNVFRGRITDANNNPVPFANITNTEDNVGTYSDAKGNFNLTFPDSVLDVQVRSIGFENNNARLRNNVNNNQVVMQDDRNNLSEVVISNKKPNAAARSRTVNVKIEEPEPEDGWDNYDTYLVNNLHVPDEIKTKQTRGDVEISFEVDKNGGPVNIKIEKSLCAKCDKEAVRLIKEGPKWKRKDRKSRATITVPF